MKITWHYDIQNEIGAYLFAAGYIAKGYFGNVAYYVLSELPAEKSLSVVYFPEFNRKLTSEEWHYCDVTNFDVPVLETTFSSKSWLKSEIEKMGVLDDFEISTLKASWQNLWPRILQVLNQIFTPSQLDIEEIKIYPTRYGATSGYYYSEEKNTGYIYIRADLPMEIILRMLLIIIIRKNYIKIEKQLGDKASLSSGKQARVDIILAYLVRATVLVEFFPPEKNHFAFEEDLNLAKQSEIYMKSLGFQKQLYLEALENGVYDSMAGRYLMDLSQLETQVLSLMLENINDLCTYEKIAKLIWGEENEEKFSLYAISKLVQRLRLKIRTNGIFDYKIKTVRNKGYLLYK